MKITKIKTPFCTIKNVGKGECFQLAHEQKDTDLSTKTIFLKTDCTDYDFIPDSQMLKGIASPLCVDLGTGKLAKFDSNEEVIIVPAEVRIR